MSSRFLVDQKATGTFPANVLTLFQCWVLLDMTSWRGTTLCILTLELTTSNNIESTLRISTLMQNTLDNLETTLYFSTSNFTMLVNVEIMLWNLPFPKNNNNNNNNKNYFKLIHWIQSFNFCFIILFSLLPILRGICWRILGKPQKLRSWKKQCCKKFI